MKAIISNPLFVIILLTCWWAAATPLYAQEVSPVLDQEPEEPTSGRTLRFDYGMTMGFYIANAGTANYYNGTGDNSVESILSMNYNYNRVRQDIGYDFQLHGLPLQMSYKPAVMLGFFGSLAFSPKASLMAEFNYAKLKAEDKFTLEIERVVFIEGDNIELYDIWGTEERLDLRFSFQYTFLSPSSYLHPFLETGLSITDTKMKENRIRIHSQTLSIRNPTNTYYQIRDYGIGFGGFATLGLKMEVNEQFALWAGYSANYSRINLGENEQFLLQHTVFLRFSLAGLASGTR
ncbi:MAG: hypothetical protein RBS53_02750 [Bacteroidales bacterium]|jgi:hypothetical protein|nr:hypothetical protein [Bacteroidales bacterium]NLM92166.1 hypothetical protein [Bacteroidales bacterium]